MQNMLNKFKKYKFIFIKEDSLYAKEFKFKDFLLPISILSICALFFISLIFFSKDVKDIITLKVISKHKKNNEELNAVINEQQKTINVLIEEINSIYEKDENLRKLINLPAIDEDIRKLGVGGSDNKSKYNHLQYLIPSKINLDKLNKNINFIKRSINLEKISYYAIGNKINEKIDYLLRYPAIYPVNKNDRKFSSRFGFRRDPFSRTRQFHDGDDFSTKIGTEVMATAKGVVKSSRYYGSFGHYIEIDHGNGYVTAYGHLSKRLVEKGDIIQRGDIIAKVGNTGKSTAPHLHYEVRLNGKHVNPNNYYFN